MLREDDQSWVSLDFRCNRERQSERARIMFLMRGGPLVLAVRGLRVAPNKVKSMFSKE